MAREPLLDFLGRWTIEVNASGAVSLEPTVQVPPPPPPIDPPPPPPPPTEIDPRTILPDPASRAHPYFDMLNARADVLTAAHLRSQAQLDVIDKGGGNDPPGAFRYPTYDPVQDAMVQRTRLGGNAVQTQPHFSVRRTSMLLTYDFKIGPGAEYKGTGYLSQYKAYRIDQGPETGLWLSTKLKFPNNVDVVNSEPAIGELLTTGGAFIGPGTTNANSEILQPRKARFWPKVNRWSRYWVFVDGLLGGAPAPKSEVVYVSIWAADEQTEPIQLYDRLAMYSPTDDICQFRFEYNTSEPARLNGDAEFWNRNFVVLTGVSLADVLPLLVKPTVTAVPSAADIRGVQ